MSKAFDASEVDMKAKARPFLKWAGGKRWALPELIKIIPEFIDYYDPFLGGGSLFFYLCNLNKGRDYYLSDINDSLINTYNQIKKNCNGIIKYLSTFRNNKTEYYKIRADQTSDSIFKAAKFIFLNKTCFNGLYRVNSRGLFNVPYGRNGNKIIFEKDNLKNVSKLLQYVEMQVCDFEVALAGVKKNDLIFLDPPYTAAYKNNGFIEYNQKIFSWEDQQRLARVIEGLIRKKAFYILTNAAHPNIDRLFAPLGKRLEITRHSTISGILKNRIKISEYIYTNCI